MISWYNKGEIMNITFDNVELSGKYTRQQLAEKWEINGTMYLNKGCVSSKDSPYVILFYTGENSCGYDNSFDGVTLKADSDEKHKTDQAKVEAYKGNKEVHLFYRSKSTDSFTYYGKLKVVKYEINTNKPSRFEYEVISPECSDNDVVMNEDKHKSNQSTAKPSEKLNTPIMRERNLMSRLKWLFNADYTNNPDSLYPFIHNIEDEQVSSRLDAAFRYYEEYLRDDLSTLSKKCIEEFFSICRNCLQNNLPIPNENWEYVNKSFRNFMFADIRKTIETNKVENQNKELTFSESWANCPGITIMDYAIDRDYNEQFWRFLLENLYKHGGDKFVCSVRNDENTTISIEINDTKGMFNFEHFTHKDGGAKAFLSSFRYGYVTITSNYYTWNSRKPASIIDQNITGYTIKVCYELPQ